jgi:hypothetical protein
MQGKALNRSIGFGAGTPVSADSLAFRGAQSGFQLFIGGFVALFLELACVRWFAAFGPGLSTSLTTRIAF